MALLYAAGHIEGDCPNSGASIGAFDASWAGPTVANTSWTSRWAMDGPGGSLSGTQTVTVRCRKTTESTNPTCAANLYENGTLVGALFAATAVSNPVGSVDLQGTFSTAAITNPANVEVQVVGLVGGGSPGNRASLQIDGIEWNATISTGSNFTQSPTDSLGLTDSVLIEKAAALAPADTDGLTDAVTLDRGESNTDNLGMTDSVSVVGPQRYITDVSANGRYFTDQDSNPILIRGESPWAMFTDLSSSEMDTYLQNRASYGCNLALVSMIGSVANGGPADTGATYDGILPFTGGDPAVFNSTYWSRMDSYIAKARDLGITLMIYPMDGWNTAFASVVFNPGSISNAQCQTYGQTLATRYLSYPNIIWAFGGDYLEDATINARFNACLTGIRAAGDTRPASIQLLYETSESHNSSFWETKVDWDWVYTYYVTYKGTSDAYNYTWSQAPTVRPALFSEGAYENSGSPHFGTDEALRRQACWALTSGSPGEMTGQEDVWDFQSGWASLLDTTAADQIKAIRDTFEALDWWTLVPDDANQLVTAGRGTRITTDSATFPTGNNYVTAARSADGTLAVIYLPNAASAITVDMGEIGANPTATWVDPTTGGTFSETTGGSYSRGNNAAADSDWLLILTGDAAAGTSHTQTPADILGLTDTATPALTTTPEVVFTVTIEIG